MTVAGAVLCAGLAASVAADPRQAAVLGAGGVAAVGAGAWRGRAPLLLVGGVALVLQYSVSLVGRPLDVRAPLLAAALALVVEGGHLAVERGAGGGRGLRLAELGGGLGAAVAGGVGGAVVLVASTAVVDQVLARAVAVGAGVVAWTVAARALQAATRP